jgi:SPP1 family phage portal protein
MTLDTIRELIRINGEVTSQIITDLIDENSGRHETMKSLYERYKASEAGVPIFSRSYSVTDDTKINNKLNNDFFSEIIDTKVGYFMGVPVVYETNSKDFEDFELRNRLELLDSEIVKLATICGTAARLLYVDTEAKIRAMNIWPWECIWVMDRSIDEVQFALRYYDMEYVKPDGSTETRERVEWYDKEKVTYYINTENGYVLDDTEKLNPQTHFFDYVPLIEYPNNLERLGDSEKVLSLIDAYDRKESDLDSELEQWRLAYMKVLGAEITAEDAEEARHTGAFNLPEGADVAFIEKNINIEAVDSHLNRLETNILRFSKSVNFADKEFTSDISGESRKYKLLSLENKCITTERQFSASNQRMFKVLASAPAFNFDWLNATQRFTRNLPVSLEKDAQILAALKGIVPDEILYSLASFIDDPKEVMKMMDEQREKEISYYPPVNLEEDEKDGETDN